MSPLFQRRRGGGESSLTSTESGEKPRPVPFVMILSCERGEGKEGRPFCGRWTFNIKKGKEESVLNTYSATTNNKGGREEGREPSFSWLQARPNRAKSEGNNYRFCDSGRVKNIEHIHFLPHLQRERPERKRGREGVTGTPY